MKLVRKMSPVAQAAAAALARQYAGPETEIAETMIGGRAFITAVDGVTLAVLIMEQDETGPIMTY